MRRPKDNERVACPETHEVQIPEWCWDSALPSGCPVTYGMLPLHHHGASWTGANNGEVCLWSGLPVEVVLPDD